MTTTTNVIDTYTAFFAHDDRGQDYVFYWNNSLSVTVHLRDTITDETGITITTEQEVDSFTFSTLPTLAEVLSNIDIYILDMNGEI